MDINNNVIFSLVSLSLLLSSSTMLSQAITSSGTGDTTTGASVAAGTIERITKQQILVSLPSSAHQTIPTEPLSHLFLTSPSGKYKAYLLRRVTMPGAGGFGNDFCYLQIQQGGHSVWESECAAVSNVNTCTLVFSDAGLEIFDGSRSTWDTDADGERLETLELLDRGDMQIREHGGNLIWRASDNPIVNQECGSIGSPGLNSAHPPFAAVVPGHNINFGQPVAAEDGTHHHGPVSVEAPSVSDHGNDPLSVGAPSVSDHGNDPVFVGAPAVSDHYPVSVGAPAVIDHDHDHENANHGEAPLGVEEEPSLGHNHSPQDEGDGLGFKSGSSFGVSNQPLVDNTPFDSGSPKPKTGTHFSVALGSILVSLLVYALML